MIYFVSVTQLEDHLYNLSIDTTCENLFSLRIFDNDFPVKFATTVDDLEFEFELNPVSIPSKFYFPNGEEVAFVLPNVGHSRSYECSTEECDDYGEDYERSDDEEE